MKINEECYRLQLRTVSLSNVIDHFSETVLYNETDPYSGSTTKEPLYTTEILSEREVHSLGCDTRTPKNKAANGFVCIQLIRTASQVQLNRSRRRTLCGTSLNLTSASEPCDYFQICATRTSRQSPLILGSTITAPNSALTSKSESQAI